jgi:Ca2+-binding RTX toxin-like protein
MSETQNLTYQVGTSTDDILSGAQSPDSIVGLSGDDTITSGGGNDVVYGDFETSNLLTGTDGATSFAQYGQSGAWDVTTEVSGHTSMTQSVDTQAG